VITSSQIYPGTTCYQAKISPFYDSYISLIHVFEENQKPFEKRTLKCPSTRNPIDPQAFLVQAGWLHDLRCDYLESHWWSYEDLELASFQEEQLKELNYSFYCIKNNDSVVNEMLLAKFQLLASLMQTINHPDQANKESLKLEKYQRIYGVPNLGFHEKFWKDVLQLENVQKIRRRSPKFSKADLIQGNRYIQVLYDTFGWLYKSEKSLQATKIIPMYHAMTQELAWKVFRQGYTDIPKAPNSEIKFTTNFDKVSKEAKGV